MDPARSGSSSDEAPHFSKRIEEAPVMDAPKNGGKGKYIGLAVLGLIVLVILVFFGSKAITGYAVYGAMEESGVPTQYVTDMQKLSSDLADAQATAAEAVSRAEEAQATLASEQKKINQERESHAATKAALEADVERYQTSLRQAESELSDADAALNDAAKRLCCVQRAVSDSSIDSYTLDDGAVSCTQGGETPISC
jgi:hypothetical protein